MMRLPFNTNTFANTYQPEAFVSGIVFGENQKHLPYFLSNYIRPVYYKNSATVLNYYIDNSFLVNHGLIKRDYTIVPKTCLQAVEWSNVARNALDNNKYVFGSFNDEFIPQKSCYNKKYFWHDYILYGYDDCGFISAAYLADRHYHEFKIAFDDFNRAVKTLKEHQFMHFLEYDNSISLDFMPDLVINAFRDYITSKELNNDGTTYGLNAFRLFANEVKNTKEEIDLRSICFLREHKLLMKMRLEYMMNNNYNVVGKHHSMRVAWINPDYIFVSGNSFVCANVTVQIAKQIVKRGVFDINVMYIIQNSQKSFLPNALENYIKQANQFYLL